MGFMDKAKDFADKHDEQVDKGLEKAGDQVDERTGNKYSAQIDKGVDQAQAPYRRGRHQQRPQPWPPLRSTAAVGGGSSSTANSIGCSGHSLLPLPAARRRQQRRAVLRVFPAVPHRPGDRVRVVPAAAVLAAAGAVPAPERRALLGLVAPDLQRRPARGAMRPRPQDGGHLAGRRRSPGRRALPPMISASTSLVPTPLTSDSPVRTRTGSAYDQSGAQNTAIVTFYRQSVPVFTHPRRIAPGHTSRVAKRRAQRRVETVGSGVAELVPDPDRGERVHPAAGRGAAVARRPGRPDAPGVRVHPADGRRDRPDRPGGQPLRVLHLGGGALTLPRYVAATRPGSAQRVVEIDGPLVELVRRALPWDRQGPAEGTGGRRPRGRHRDPGRRVRPGRRGRLRRRPDARPPGHGRVHPRGGPGAVPRPAGLANVADGPPLRYARAQVATIRSVLPQACLVADAAVLRGRRFGNLVVLAGRTPPPVAELTRRAAGDWFPGRVEVDLDRFTGGWPRSWTLARCRRPPRRRDCSARAP